MISRLKARDCGILMILLASLLASPCNGLAQTSAPGLLQPAYMPQQTMMPQTQMIHQAQPMQPFHVQPSLSPIAQTTYAQPQKVFHASPVQAGQTMGYASSPVQQSYYLIPQPISPAPNHYPDAAQMVNSRVPRRGDLMETNQHTLFQYRRLYRDGTTPQPHELVGQWNGVNKGIVQIAGYGQFIKDIQVSPNGQIYGDNIQVSQVKPGQVRFDGWQPNFDYRTSDYERIGKFQVQTASGRGFFGHGATLSYADGGNPKGDPSRLLLDQVVRIDGNHMLGRAVAKFGPIRIPLAYFVLERRQ